tara:strand:+ start:2572 stop:2856 length:285 start_codon:yes stop_codon:yes gene_type:complete
MFELSTNIPLVTVSTTENRGFTPEEVAQRCVAKIISVSDSAHPGIREQAKAFQEQIEGVVAFYMREAIRSDRTTVSNLLKETGYSELADAIRRL